jgi:hypothetical protein
MEKKYILIATPLKKELKDSDNDYSGKDIIELISGAYFESSNNNQQYNIYSSNKEYEILSSRDKSVELIFIIANNCQNIYNGITFNHSFRSEHAHILSENLIDLVITVVKENSFIEFFHNHWNFFNVENEVPVISIRKQLSTIDDKKYLGSTYIYNRKRQLIELNINSRESYFIQNFFSQLVYSLIKKPELIIYCSTINKKYTFIQELCNKFFPNVSVKIAHPHKNNALLASELITSSKNKITLFMLDEVMIDLENLNFFLDLYYSLPERSLISCSSQMVENKINDFMFYKALEARIEARKIQYKQYADGDTETQQCLRNLELLSNEISNIRNFLQQGDFFGEDINADSHMLYRLEKQLNMEFASVGIVSGVKNSEIEAYITEILEENFESTENYNKYYTINADNVNFTDRGDFHQKN